MSRFSYLPNGVVATIEDALTHHLADVPIDAEDWVSEVADQIADSLYAAGHLKIGGRA